MSEYRPGFTEEIKPPVVRSQRDAAGYTYLWRKGESHPELVLPYDMMHVSPDSPTYDLHVGRAQQRAGHAEATRLGLGPVSAAEAARLGAAAGVVVCQITDEDRLMAADTMRFSAVGAEAAGGEASTGSVTAPAPGEVTLPQPPAAPAPDQWGQIRPPGAPVYYYPPPRY